MKKLSMLTALLILFNSCYSYKSLEFPEMDFVVGEKYEIRVGDREMEKVLVNQVTDSTIIVLQNKTEITIKKSMVTESKLRKFSMGKTIAACTLGVLLTIVTIGTISWSSGSGNGATFECC
ncbi:hypothetical protein GTQ34_13265 [Muricauda sp. JGD-17]|uniref:Uncharacterized protein n=1 Tax=Flagellimonas ochracea TaxID=2696472 RepID=A0A964TEV1_9FLAO|nr:hypothetical protein [Allomuricauda ochracea]NAY92886.1 hypothetical protein [Allomuricauda ochracea]